jgi:hypothetical protein
VTPIDGDFASAFPAVSTAGDRAAIARGNAVEIYEQCGIDNRSIEPVERLMLCTRR